MDSLPPNIVRPPNQAALVNVDVGARCAASERVAEDGVQTGELVVRGPWVTGDYYNHPTATDDAFVQLDGTGDDPWLRTGDIASMESGGAIAICDRAKDLIKSGGEWISSADLEGHATAIEGISLAAVVGRPHPKWDERPIVVAVVDGDSAGGAGTTAEELLAALRAHLEEHGFARYELPDDVVLWDALPLTGTGKLDKKVVRTKLDAEGYVLPSLR